MANGTTDFDTWIDTFVSEKGLDRDRYFEKEGPEWGMNLIPLGVVIDTAKATAPCQQAAIKATLVKIDFCNGDPMDYFDHLAGCLAR